MTDEQIIELEKTLPPVFARSAVPELFGGLISYGRLANIDSEGWGPKKITIGRKVGYLRCDFIAWMRLRSIQLQQVHHIQINRDG